MQIDIDRMIEIGKKMGIPEARTRALWDIKGVAPLPLPVMQPLPKPRPLIVKTKGGIKRRATKKVGDSSANPWRRRTRAEEMAKSGMRDSEIAQILDCSPERIRQFRRDAGIPTLLANKWKELEGDREEILEAYRNGEPIYKIAPRLDLPYVWVRQMIKKAGIRKLSRNRISKGDRVCSDCNQFKLVTEFPSGAYYKCKDCWANYTKELRDRPTADRVCSKCKQWRTADQYNKSCRTRCRQCQSAYSREYNRRKSAELK